MSQLRRLLLVTATLVAVTAPTWAAAPVSSAEAVYGCLSSPCEKASGPNEDPVNIAQAWNESGNGVCARLWRFNGGSSYTLMGEECRANEKYAVINIGQCPVDGHGTVARYYDKFLYYLLGKQWFDYEPEKSCA